MSPATASTSTTAGLLTDDAVRADFLKQHADLLEATWSQITQATLARGELPEVLSYPEALRFAHSGAAPRSAPSPERPRREPIRVPR